MNERAILRCPIEKPRAINHVRLAGDDRLHEGQDISRVVLKIGVLNHDHVSRDAAEPRSQGAAFALVLRLEDDMHVAGGFVLTRDLPRSVGAGVIDNDDLFRNRQGDDVRPAPAESSHCSL